MTYRVIAQEKGFYLLDGGEGELLAEVRGRLRHEAASGQDYPVVGDEVLAVAQEGRAVIERVLPRRSLIVRRMAGGEGEQPIAANVDTLFVCMTLGDDFNLRRLERYLAIAWESGARPVVLLTKPDLCARSDERLAQAQAAAPGVAVLCVGEYACEAWTLLAPWLGEGQTVAFVGSSGAGKSTLTNRLLGEERLATGAVSADGHGRHTTTRRQLLHLPGGACVIDTPGMREVGLWGAEEGLDAAFADIDALAQGCRFRDCAHEREPGCAVRAAVEAGELDEGRYRAYLALREENRRAQDKAAFLAAKNEKFKQIARINRRK